MISNLKTFMLTAAVGSVALFGCGEGTGEKIEEHTDSLTTNIGNAIDSMTVNKDADAEFLSDAVEANTLELRALTLGKEKGGKEVKTHAGHMMADHKKLGEGVAAYIAKKNLILEDVDTTDMDNDLNDKAAGKEFDKAWADKMVNDHEKVISMFEDAQDDVKDPELKTMITDALPKLRSHLDMAKQLKEKMDKAN